MFDKLKKALSTVAPTLGAALGGPLGGSAGRILSLILAEKESASEEEVLKALENPSHEIILKLKEADYNFTLEMERIAASDRQGARERETKMAETGHRDYLPSILSVLIIAGFFCAIYLVMNVHQEAEDRDILYMMLGILGTAFISIVNYYFGSSNSSTQKNKMLEKYIK